MQKAVSLMTLLLFAVDRTERPDSPMLDVEGVSADEEEDQGEPTNRRHRPFKCLIITQTYLCNI